MEQRSPDLEGGGIEGDVRDLGDALFGRQLDIVGAEHQARDRALLDLHALGAAGRARGIHHVGQAASRGRATRPQRRHVAAGKPLTGRIEHQHRDVTGELRRRPVGEEHPRCRVRDHQPQPLGGIARIERQVGAAGLEDAQGRPHHGSAALHGKRHPRLAAGHPRPAQTVRQPVGQAVEPAVAQADVTVDHRHGVGGARHLALEQLDQPGARIGGPRVVPAREHLVAFGRAQQRHLAEPRLAWLSESLEHGAEVPTEA